MKTVFLLEDLKYLQFSHFPRNYLCLLGVSEIDLNSKWDELSPEILTEEAKNEIIEVRVERGRV